MKKLSSSLMLFSMTLFWAMALVFLQADQAPKLTSINPIVQAQNTNAQPNTSPYPRIITAKELHPLLQSQTPPILLDVSQKGHYLIAHLPHAKHFSIHPDSLSNDGKLQWSKKNATQAEFKEKLGADLHTLIVIYDQGDTLPPQTSLADIACMWAEKLGYKNVYRLAGGLKIWKESRFKTTNETPQCCH